MKREVPKSMQFKNIDELKRSKWKIINQRKHGNEC